MLTNKLLPSLIEPDQLTYAENRVLFPKHITVMEDVFALWFPISFWLNPSVSPLMFYVSVRHLLAESPFHSLWKVSSDFTRKISPQVKMLYQKSKSCTSRDYRSAWELVIAGLVIHTGELKPFYLGPFQSEPHLKARRKKNEGHAIRRFAKYTDLPTSPNRSHPLETTAWGGLLLSHSSPDLYINTVSCSINWLQSFKFILLKRSSLFSFLTTTSQKFQALFALVENDSGNQMVWFSLA